MGGFIIEDENRKVKDESRHDPPVILEHSNPNDAVHDGAHRIETTPYNTYLFFLRFVNP
jgi:hypothetical protein